MYSKKTSYYHLHICLFACLLKVAVVVLLLEINHLERDPLQELKRVLWQATLKKKGSIAKFRLK